MEPDDAGTRYAVGDPLRRNFFDVSHSQHLLLLNHRCCPSPLINPSFMLSPEQMKETYMSKLLHILVSYKRSGLDLVYPVSLCINIYTVHKRVTYSILAEGLVLLVSFTVTAVFLPINPFLFNACWKFLLLSVRLYLQRPTHHCNFSTAICIKCAWTSWDCTYMLTAVVLLK